MGILSFIVSADPTEGGTVFALIPFLYEALFLSGSKGATPGKQAMGIKVIKNNGQKISFFRALSRCFAEFISAFILYIGFIMAAFDSKKQALHDHICDTYVVYS